jgi:hypothetical protein
MTEHDGSNKTPEVTPTESPVLEKPFAASRTESGWSIIVNRPYFIAKGFTPDEIEGATHLELERLDKQTSADTKEAVAGLRAWQDLTSDGLSVSAFKTAFERLAALKSLELREPENAELARKFLEKYAKRLPAQNNQDQLFNLVLKKGLGQDPTVSAGPVATVLSNLERKEKIEDRVVSPLDALFNEDLSFSAKASWFEARLLPRLEFLAQQDKLKAEKEQKEETPQSSEESQEPPTPPPSQDDYEQHRGREEKGKGAPTFIIEPGRTGYWEGESYDILNEATGKLSKSDTQKIKTSVSQVAHSFTENSARTVRGQTGTDLFSLPLASSFEPTQEGLDAMKGEGMDLYTDAEGHFFIKSPDNKQFSIHVAQITGEPAKGINFLDTVTSDSIPQEIQTELDRIKNATTSSFDRIVLWQDYVQTAFRYPQDDQVESMYRQVDQSSSRISAMTQVKLLDCYLAREFFIAGLKRLELSDVEWRSANGYYASSKQKDGAVHLGSGNAHAWVKLRTSGSSEWIIFDPTPPGDPIHEGEGSQEEFADSSPELLSEEDMKQLEQEANEDGEKQTRQTQDEYLMQFATDAGVLPEEARQILEILKGVDETKDRQGRNILKRLKEQFDRIIEYYTVQRREFSGQVEMSRGFELDDPVAATIDVKSGTLDPTGFKKARIIEEKEEYYGGLDLEIVADGSGSMSESLGSKQKYLVQRDMSYLLHRALHRFSQEAQRRKLRLVTPLKIRSSQFIFRGSDIEQIKLLTDEFTPAQMATLWKESAENIGGGTPAHLGLQAILDRIKPEEVQLLQDKKLLKVVALISDGGYDDATRVNALKRQLEDMNVIVAEFPINNSQSLESLPQNVAEKVIETAQQLMPERIKR